MQTIALVIHVFLAVGLIGLVLIQHGKGAEAGAAFGGGGGGASATVFGSKGSGSFLTRLTTMFALAFFCTSMLLFFLASQRSSSGIGSVIDNVDVPAQQVDVPSTDTPEADTPETDTPATDEGASDVPSAPAADTTTESEDTPAVPETE